MPLDIIGILLRFQVAGQQKVTQALNSLNKNLQKTTTATNNLTAAGKKAAAQNAKTAASIKAYSTIAASFVIQGLVMFGVIQKITRAAREQAQAIFENTDEYEALAEASDRVQRAFFAAILPFDETLELMERGAFLANQFADNLLTLSAIIAGIRAVDVPEFVPKGATFGFQVAQLAGGEGQAAFSEAFNARIEEQGRAMESTAEEATNYDRAINSLLQSTQRFDQVLERNAQAIAKVNEQFNQAQASATGKLFSRLHQIQLDFQKNVTKIDAAALKSRTRAFANFERQITEMQQREVDNRERLRQQNQLEREFATRRFQLSQIQSERQFQSDRGFLVAEGDVLAIERLDERHRIEQLDREENFRLQEQQTEAMFRLQLRFQEQAMRQQIAALGTALKEQLASIEENRQERIAAQKELAEEERMEAKQAFGQQIADALAAQIEQTNNLKAQLAEREAAMAESLANLIRQNNLAAPQVMEAWRAIYGPNAEFDQLITQAIARNTRRLMQLQRGITGGRRTPFLPITMRAHGGDDIVTRPTLFMAGEAGTERVITQPMGSIGGNVSVSWKGGPIQIQGSGLEGADVSGLGNQLVEGLMISLSSAVQNARGVR